MTNVFGPFFPVLSSMTRLMVQYIRVHKLFFPLLYNVEEHFLRPRKLLKTQKFVKKGNLSSEKNY